MKTRPKLLSKTHMLSTIRCLIMVEQWSMSQAGHVEGREQESNRRDSSQLPLNTLTSVRALETGGGVHLHEGSGPVWWAE